MPSPPERKKALIFGVSGQDGAYLAQLLLSKGYEVHGTSRQSHNKLPNLHFLGIAEQVKLIPCDMLDPTSIRETLATAAPDEIYNLAGQSSVSYSFENPLEAIQSIAHSTLNLLEAMRQSKSSARLFHASSAECFGDLGPTPANEDTPFKPKSPYAVAKASAHFQVGCFREAFGLYACSGILFNHESPLRPRRFVTQKIIAAAGDIARGSREKLHLGNISVVRDWGWASEYVHAMWLMLQQPTPQDFIIATGQSHSLSDFVDATFAAIGHDSTDFVIRDRELLRPTEIQWSYADAGRIQRQLGWSATSKMNDVVRLMLEADAIAHTAELTKTRQ